MYDTSHTTRVFNFIENNDVITDTVNIIWINLIFQRVVGLDTEQELCDAEARQGTRESKSGMVLRQDAAQSKVAD